MNLQNYQSPKQSPWKGRDDGPAAKRIHQVIELRSLLDLQSALPPAFALLGFACDEGVRRNQGHVGAAMGPQALREALAGLPFPRKDACRLLDCGDIICQDGNLEEAQDALAEAVKTLLELKMTPIILGGGHEVSWGHYQGIMRAKPGVKCPIINFDAHYDLRPKVDGKRGSSGTPFLQIAEAAGEQFSYSCLGIQSAGNTPQLFEKAKDLGVRTVMAELFHRDGWEAGRPLIESLIKEGTPLYLTVCLDVFAAPYAPGVSARQPLGLLPWHVLPLVEELAASGSVLSFDIAELSPPRDQEGLTAQLGAALIHRFIAKCKIGAVPENCV